MMLDEVAGASSVENSSQLLRWPTAAETMGEKEKALRDEAQRLEPDISSGFSILQFGFYSGLCKN